MIWLIQCDSADSIFLPTLGGGGGDEDGYAEAGEEEDDGYYNHVDMYGRIVEEGEATPAQGRKIFYTGCSISLRILFHPAEQNLYSWPAQQGRAMSRFFYARLIR